MKREVMKVLIFTLIILYVLLFSYQSMLANSYELSSSPSFDIRIQTFPYHICSEFFKDDKIKKLLQFEYETNYLVLLKITYPKTVLDDFITVKAEAYIDECLVFYFFSRRFSRSYSNCNLNNILLPYSNNGIITFYFINKKNLAKNISAGEYNIPITFTFYPLVEW